MAFMDRLLSLACDDGSILAFMAQVRMRKLESQGPAGPDVVAVSLDGVLRPRRTRARAMPT